MSSTTVFILVGDQVISRCTGSCFTAIGFEELQLKLQQVDAQVLRFKAHFDHLVDLRATRSASPNMTYGPDRKGRGGKVKRW
jgi:hypothetical protein